MLCMRPTAVLHLLATAWGSHVEMHEMSIPHQPVIASTLNGWNRYNHLLLLLRLLRPLFTMENHGTSSEAFWPNSREYAIAHGTCNRASSNKMVRNPIKTDHEGPSPNSAGCREKCVRPPHAIIRHRASRSQTSNHYSTGAAHQACKREHLRHGLDFSKYHITMSTPLLHLPHPVPNLNHIRMSTPPLHPPHPVHYSLWQPENIPNSCRTLPRNPSESLYILYLHSTKQSATAHCQPTLANLQT